jgi:hypothetical protein
MEVRVFTEKAIAVAIKGIASRELEMRVLRRLFEVGSEAPQAGRRELNVLTWLQNPSPSHSSMTPALVSPQWIIQVDPTSQYIDLLYNLRSRLRP